MIILERSDKNTLDGLYCGGYAVKWKDSESSNSYNLFCFDDDSYNIYSIEDRINRLGTWRALKIFRNDPAERRENAIVFDKLVKSIRDKAIKTYNNLWPTEIETVYDEYGDPTDVFIDRPNGVYYFITNSKPVIID